MSDPPDEDSGQAEVLPDRPFRDLRGVPGGRPSRSDVQAGLREVRRSELRGALAVHEALCVQMDRAVAELRAAMDGARRLDEAESAAAPDSPSLARAVRGALDATKSVLQAAADSTSKVRDREESLLSEHEALCARMELAAGELKKALGLSLMLDRASGSGLNVEARLGRRLGVKGIQRTLHAAHSQVVRTARMSRARAGAQGRAVEDEIDSAAGLK